MIEFVETPVLGIVFSAVLITVGVVILIVAFSVPSKSKATPLQVGLFAGVGAFFAFFGVVSLMSSMTASHYDVTGEITASKESLSATYGEVEVNYTVSIDGIDNKEFTFVLDSDNLSDDMVGKTVELWCYDHQFEKLSTVECELTTLQ